MFILLVLACSRKCPSSICCKSIIFDFCHQAFYLSQPLQFSFYSLSESLLDLTCDFQFGFYVYCLSFLMLFWFQHDFENELSFFSEALFYSITMNTLCSSEWNSDAAGIHKCMGKINCFLHYVYTLVLTPSLWGVYPYQGFIYLTLGMKLGCPLTLFTSDIHCLEFAQIQTFNIIYNF